MNVNKKLWSFIFGCCIAASSVWLISFGRSADVIPYFEQYPDFVIDYYALMVTALATFLFTLCVVLIMKLVFNLLSREHPFWLILPSLTLILLTVLSSKIMLLSILSTAIPALIVLVCTAIVGRVMNIANIKKETS